MKVNTPYRAAGAWLGILLTLFVHACQVPQRLSRQLIVPEAISQLDISSPFLKVHMLNGQVYVLESWSANGSTGTVKGQGVLYNEYRQQIAAGTFEVSIDSVVMFETNQVSPGVVAPALISLTVVSAALWVLCIPDKACFGSCPTFYVRDGESNLLHAEGFSASVARSLEARDIDALYRAQPDNGTLIVEMANEALETHMVRQANILAVPRRADERVLSDSEGRFWRTGRQLTPDSCAGLEGDCLPEILALDGAERYSATDADDLADRETIELVFTDVPEGLLGLVIASRQTLLTTYLFYQGMAYMGQSAEELMAELQTRSPADDHPLGPIGDALGGLEVQLRDDRGVWTTVGVDYETGPLATDLRLMPLGDLATSSEGSLEVRLRMAKGNIRLDYLALTNLIEKAQPLRIRPAQVLHNGTSDDAAGLALRDSEDYLMTMPGDIYTLIYDIPKGYENSELFLESQGYYMEWMREAWRGEEDLLALRQMFKNPQRALRDLAPRYKEIEDQIEDLFWGSRYAGQILHP